MEIGAGLRGKRVFVTGHTGFKGSWLVMLLHRAGAHVTGYSLAPPTNPSLFEAARLRELVSDHHEGDIRDASRLASAVAAAQPDVVMHLAAQPLVRLSHRKPLDTFSTNVVGTASVLDAVRALEKPCAVIVVTSDKCYEPHDDGRPHDEADSMGGRDPYSASKGAAELVTAAYRRSYFAPERLAEHGVQLATVRAGNVIGGGDWAEDRIVTDVVRHLVAGKPVPVRNPLAVRPWQHVLEPLSGYLALAEAMLTETSPRWCDGWNFGPAAGGDITVRELVEIFIDAWGSGTWENVHDPRAPIETHVLRLAIDKAIADISWRPRLTAPEAIRRTAAWFHEFATAPACARALCDADIARHEVA
ncbi:MAG: CDP-glucose 4,6-dehydratase [Planctomycetes bacterium]|nr:CDP-glucose 4,6-dehydratase [Planctomycetota bacterium]